MSESLHELSKFNMSYYRKIYKFSYMRDFMWKMSLNAIMGYMVLIGLAGIKRSLDYLITLIYLKIYLKHIQLFQILFDMKQ